MATPAEIKNNQTNRRGGARPGAGRKRGSLARATAEQKRSLENRAQEHADTALAALVDIATTGESEAARVSAASALLDRGFGKPRQSIETEDVTKMPKAERRERLMKLLA